MSSQDNLSERAQLLLSTLIQHYVADGRPVGSGTLAGAMPVKLSPATIRNVMADLEDMGLVVSPHTSAGRIPTAKGYRLFVDRLLSVKPLDSLEIDALRQKILRGDESQNLMGSVSDLLSGVTNMAGLVTLPKIGENAWRHIEFLPLSDSRVLTIMVLNDQQVQNRVIKTARPYTPSELQQAANYLNASFSGKSLQEVRRQIVREMHEAKDNMDKMMQAAMEMAGQVCENEPVGEGYVMAGQINLMSFNELSNVEKLRGLFEAFGQKRDILHLLDQCQHAEGVQIFIGEESGYQVLDECSMVASPYKVDGEVVGVLGVIGPTRMAYDRIIPIVDITARLLGMALNPRH